MRKILNKYSYCVFFFWIGSLFVLAEDVPSPDPHECCEAYAPASGQIEDASQEYKDCISSSDPSIYCKSLLPVDNSIYIYMSMVAAVALASFVIIRNVTHKKTPI